LLPKNKNICVFQGRRQKIFQGKNELMKRRGGGAGGGGGGGGGGSTKKDRKIAKKTSKIALFSLSLLYLYYV